MVHAPRFGGPSDAGLSGERTSLAWARIGLSLIGFPTAVAAYAGGQGLWVPVALMMLAAAAGLAVLVLSLRRQRAVPGMVAQRAVVLSGRRVLATTAAVILLGMGSLALVLA